MYHPSMWHPIQPLDMAAAFRSIRQTTSSPNSTTTSPDKNSLSAAVAAFNAANGAFSVNTLLNQTSSDHLRFPSAHPSITAAAAAHQHQLFSTLFQHYPYAAAFRPLLNGTATGLLTSSANSNSSLSSSSESSESSAFLPTGKRFKNNTHDENHCDISPSEKSSDESFGKYSESRCRSSTYDLQNPQCPICQISLNGQDMMTHIQQELDTIERTRQQHKYSIRRSSHLTNGNNKILQENTINNIDQTFKTRYETYIRVRTSRQQRLSAKLQLHNRRLNRNDTRNCPICYQIIPMNTDEEYFCSHVQQCSRKREQLAANAALAAMANQHRLPQPPPPPPLVISTRDSIQDDPDVNVVDMDDGIEHEDNNSNRQSTNETTSTADHSDDRCQESFNSDQRFSPSTQKSDLLFSSNVTELDPPKCVVCM
ncbi:unnamed protein product [Rotaria magnacalcarata]|nr:unnamed protein product [Rotaria magnacalcarata]CAF2126052.1 unnamed protein product [Rotaria magnacalcarata]